MTKLPTLITAGLLTALATGAASAQTQQVPSTQASVSLGTCVELVSNTISGETTHLEFESRSGVPTYEFIVQSEAGPRYYVGCDATTGLLGEVDVIVEADDERFASVSQVSAQQAADIATRYYPGEVEEVKSLLLSTGEAVYEVDVEVEPEGEFNVYVNAETGGLFTVNIEYYEIGQSATNSDQLDGSEAGAGGDDN